jgi:hypothetical protein
MVEVYTREEDRCRAFRETCEVYGLPLRAAAVGPAPYQTDGDLRSHTAMLLVTEGKNEWHSLNADPVLQAALYYITAVKWVTEDEFNDDISPCLLVHYVGWWCYAL